MFSSKKDEEIAQLKIEIEDLKLRIKAEEDLRLDTQKKADREHTEFLIYKKETSDREDYFNAEIARLKRVTTSEKKKRINSACANRRRNLGRKGLN